MLICVIFSFSTVVTCSQAVKALGPDTLLEIAKAGPATQAALLEGLGLKGYLITGVYIILLYISCTSSQVF